MSAGMKRKSITTFFGPVKQAKSEMDDSMFRWEVVHGTLIKARYDPAQKAKNVEEKQLQSDELVRIAAFDLDSTLVSTKTRSPFPRNGEDWKWAFESVVDVIRKMANHGKVNEVKLTSKCKELYTNDSPPFIIAIISNQGGTIARPDTKRYQYLYQRIHAITQELGVPARFYGATKPPKGTTDEFRKPKTKMWTELLKDLSITADQVDMANSFFVGDALGRKTDFSDSDKVFAQSLGLKCYSPEDIFQL
jgi:DNA 3'-phosphatase